MVVACNGSGSRDGIVVVIVGSGDGGGRDGDSGDCGSCGSGGGWYTCK